MTGPSCLQNLKKLQKIGETLPVSRVIHDIILALAAKKRALLRSEERRVGKECRL